MFDIKNVIEKMDRAIDAYKKEIAKQRVGRAQPALIASLMVHTYGTEQALSQISSITAESATVLAVKPWDKKLIPSIERAIHGSDLGLNPVTAGDTVRVPLPALTEERRKDIVKQVKTSAEQAKVGLRNLRRDANTEIKALEKDNKVSEDESKRFQDKVQEATDKFIKMIDTLTQEKENEIMKI
jgi:ribosome recycling factor